MARSRDVSYLAYYTHLFMHSLHVLDSPDFLARHFPSVFRNALLTVAIHVNKDLIFQMVYSAVTQFLAISLPAALFT